MAVRWPWVSILLAVLVAVSPPGQEVYQGFFSGEALARDMSWLLFLIGLAVLALVAALEWLIRLIILKRRVRGTTT